MHADDTRFVLVGTSHAGNVGAAARAMKVMGFRDLVLVAPRFPDVASHEEAVAHASGAADVLARARVVPSLAEALDGVTHACATAMTPRDFGPPSASPREHFARLAGQERQRLAFVFGSERFGLANDDIYRCHACLTIPTAADYASLNLAQAVQLIAYDWRQALGGLPLPVARRADDPIADGTSVQAALEHWREALTALGFLDRRAPRKLMPRLNQLLNRAQPARSEVQVLRGIARAVLERCAGVESDTAARRS